MRLLEDRLMIKTNPPKELKTSSGILLAQTTEPFHIEGTVVQAGETCKVIKKGDVVVYTRHSGNEFNHEGERYLLMRESDIIIILN
jgi:chaperonin GroES